MEIKTKKPSRTVKPLQCQKVTSDVIGFIVHANNLMAGPCTNDVDTGSGPNRDGHERQDKAP